MMTISSEVGVLLAVKCTDFNHRVADLKIKQITRLSYAATLLYMAAGTYVLSGIIGSLLGKFAVISNALLIAGTISVFMALILLIIYAFRTISIRRMQFENNHLI